MTRGDAAAYAALCLLAGSLWIADAALPVVLPGASGLLADHVLLALVCFLAARRLPGEAFRIFGYSAVVLAVPVALASLAEGKLSSTTIVLVYTLVPAATVFFAAQVAQEEFLGRLGPALAGVAGAALILPFALPASATGACWMGAMVLSALAAGFGAMRLHALLAQEQVLPASAVAAAAGALVALPLLVMERPERVLLTWPQMVLSEAVHLALAGATLLLSVRLLRNLRPVAFSARYLLVPLVTILEGYAVLHPVTGWTFVAGLLLLGGASVLLLRPEC